MTDIATQLAERLQVSLLYKTTHIYCDGGVVGKNPSDFGGTWAFVCVRDDEVVAEQSGFVPTVSGRKFTNNWSEQIAMIRALEYMPEQWSGIICSDSKVALGRMFQGWKCNNLPSNIGKRMRSCLKKLGKVYPQHIGGHPTKDELILGINSSGDIVSKWNVRADELCNLEVKKYFESKGRDENQCHTTSKESEISSNT